jgi:transposase
MNLHRKFPNTSAGVATLDAWLQQQEPGEQIALEATGRYGEAVARDLFEHGYAVSYLNPKQIHAFAQIPLHGQKTDNVFKTAGGKFVAPQRVENKLKNHLLIDQAMIPGENREKVAALITPDRENLKTWCQQHDIAWQENLESILQMEPVQQKYEAAVQQANQSLDHTGQIDDFRLIPAQASVDASDSAAGSGVCNRRNPVDCSG